MSANATSSWLGIPETVSVFGTQVAPLTILLTIAVIVAGFVVARFARIVTTKYIGTKLPPDTRRTLGRTTYYAIIAIALLSALGISGLDLSGIFLAGGIAGIVIGGGGIVAATPGKDVEIEPGTVLRVRLDQPPIVDAR